MTQNFIGLNEWVEITKGIYRNVFCAGACYEMIITCWDPDSDILTAKADLYISGTWSTDVKGKWLFTRELLLANSPLPECMAAAQEDYNKMVQEEEEEK